MTNHKPVRPADKAVVDGVNQYVLKNVTPLVVAANQQKAALETRLGSTEARLTEARAEARRLSDELDGRPTTGQLEAARTQVRELETQVEELRAASNRLREELDHRPSEPDQVLDLVRQELDPIFAQARRELGMEPTPAEAGSETSSGSETGNGGELPAAEAVEAEFSEEEGPRQPERA